MSLMSTTTLLSDISALFNRRCSCCCFCSEPVRVRTRVSRSFSLSNTYPIVGRRRRRGSWGCGHLVPGAAGRRKHARHSRGKSSSWWKKLFFEEEGNWGGSGDDDDMAEDEGVGGGDGEKQGEDGGMPEREKFEAWKRRAEVIIELREAQEGARNEKGRNWEDWIVLHDETNGGMGYGWGGGGGGGVEGFREAEESGDPDDIIPARGLVESVRDLVLGREDDDLLYEDRVFRYASLRSARFLAILIIIPWALDFLVHDCILMPFLERYVKTVPLAAEILDVRRSQKLEIVRELKLEKARFRLEAEIGKAPPLSEDEMFLELRQKAIELCDNRRLENRRSFAYIWSDLLFGISLFILLYLNQSEIALLKFTGYKILNNISDAGKAFLIILLADIFLGYHSEVGWQALCEILLEHYGLELDQSAITIFICLFPVAIDACVKLWLFRFLPGLSPKVAKILQEMTRH